MLISALQAFSFDQSTEIYSEEDMPAIMSNTTNSLLSSKRSASSVSEADCYNMSLGAGPLWWSDAPGEARGSSPPPLRLTFRTARQPWEAVLKGRTLYIALPPQVLPEGSREAFVGLLEAAEEQLKCEHVVVVFAADRPDRAVLVRTFMFLGFAVLAPTSPLVPPSMANGNVCMLYNIE
ncbi:LOW QUALITY PROTEIN: ornithine decarboxylase antizyme 1 [Diorhabda sublineata]|uniref:LOW QUALITY PROTEIN: ornithine decarboxylase antizyme 1 n=1 Tax=Diorhabda sublineata TaxID=1163346 RepID=UPI0024E14659|nr:LOW QUALITY PROTEIN: ornithine decarboxylase antizyme 1 [Diorhabda sublineata]